MPYARCAHAAVVGFSVWVGVGGGGGQSAKKQDVQGKIKQKIHARQVTLDRG